MQSGSNKNNKIVFFDDIIKELSEELELPYDELEELCSLSLEYVKKSTKKRDVLTIHLPELGNLYYSQRLGKFYEDRYKNYDETIHKKSKKTTYDFFKYRNDLVEKLEKGNKSYHRRKPLLYKFKNLYKKLNGGKIVKGGATIGHQELWSYFSDKQNEIQNEE